MYVQYKVNVSENQMDTLKDAIRLKKGTTLCFPKGGINRLDNAQAYGRRVQIRMSARQVAKNVSYTGGYLAALAPPIARALPLAARVMPTIMSGLVTGLVRDGLYLHKLGKCYRVQKVKGNGLYLAPHPRFVEGLFLKHGNDISDGAGLLMGKNSPFKNIPILGWLL